MQSLFVLVTLAVGCSGQGMLSIPPNCERDSCLAYAQWTQVDSATIQFELEATSPGWVAVGVSADQLMGTNGIDDVFACQRDATNDTVYAQDTYNPQSPRRNIRDTDQSGFQLISSSFSGGRIFCSFTRSILADNLAEDRNLNESAFVLLAFGDARGGPNVVLAAHNAVSRRASPAQIMFTNVATSVPAVGMLSIPPNCERDSCMAYAQWTQVDSATVQFELEATSPGWVAVGVSADQVMGTNGIDDVFACQRDATNDTVYAEDTYNPQDQSPRRNIRDTDQSGFQLISSSFSGGRIFCSFTRSILADNLAEDRNLNESAFVLLAFGDARGGPDVVLAAHNGASRRASDTQVAFTDVVTPMPMVPCTPDSCRSYCPPGFYLNPSSCECECRTSCGYDEVLDDYTCQCQKKSQYPDVQCSSLHYISTCLNSEPLYGISCLWQNEECVTECCSPKPSRSPHIGYKACPQLDYHHCSKSSYCNWRCGLEP